MTLNNFIVVLLGIIPVIWVFSDIKKGKIKNIFIFPYFVLLLIFTFFIDWFYNNTTNIIQILLLSALWYLFYVNNKWWAWDGKYIIVLWISLVIIWYLKWFEDISILFIKLLFFIITSVIVWYIILSNKTTKINKKKIKIDILDTLSMYSTIFVFISIFTYYYSSNYSYIIIFLLLFVISDFYKRFKIHKYIKIIFICIWIFVCIYSGNYIWFVLSYWVYIIFIWLSSVINDMLSDIDTKEITIGNINKWDILTEKSIEKVNKDTDLSIVLSPLQWEEVFKIIEYYKKNNELQTQIEIYKDIRVWIYFYIAYIMTLLVYYNF